MPQTPGTVTLTSPTSPALVTRAGRVGIPTRIDSVNQSRTGVSVKRGSDAVGGEDHWIRGSELYPVFSCALLDGAQPQALFDLTGYTVSLILRPADRSRAVLQLAATVVSAAEGSVRYDWASGDTVEPGDYDAVWRAVTAAGAAITFPNQAPPMRLRIETSP